MMLVEPLYPFMTLQMIPGLSRKEVGYYSGILFSSFFFGNLFGALILSYAADKYGRRPILILGTFAVPFMCIAFGFCKNFLMAVTTRVLWGVFLGIIPVARASL